MGLKFYHGGIINIINRDLPLLLKGDMKEKYEYKGNITIDKLSVPYITGSGDSEQKISENVIKISGKKDVQLTYIEDTASAELKIKIGKKIVGSVKKMGGLSVELVTALAFAVDEDVKSLT